MKSVRKISDILLGNRDIDNRKTLAVLFHLDGFNIENPEYFLILLKEGHYLVGGYLTALPELGIFAKELIELVPLIHNRLNLLDKRLVFSLGKYVKEHTYNVKLAAHGKENVLGLSLIECLRISVCYVRSGFKRLDIYRVNDLCGGAAELVKEEPIAVDLGSELIR